MSFDYALERALLTVTKVKTIHQRDLDIYEARLSEIEQQVEQLKQASIMLILGDSYGRLVLLEDVRQSKANMDRPSKRRSTTQRSHSGAFGE